MEKKRQEEMEREMLIRAAKSRYWDVTNLTPIRRNEPDSDLIRLGLGNFAEWLTFVSADISN